MANTFSNVMPTLIAQALITLREACVMPRLVNTDFANLPSGIGDTVNVTIPSAAAVTDVTASETPVTPPNVVPTKATVTLNKWRKAGFHLTDKERGEIPNGIVPGQMAEAVKSLANDINAYLFSLYTGVYGYVGTAAQTPFGTNLSEATDARKKLNQQLAPLTDRRIVLDPSAEANAILRLANYNLRGTDGTLVTGQIGTILGQPWFMDQAVPTHTSTALSAGAATCNGVNAIGATTLSVAKATNTSPLVKGDIITIATGPAAGDYVVVTGVTLTVGNTNVTISPGLRGATAGAEVISLKATHVVNLNFHRDAFAFASRALQSEAANSENIISMPDPVSKIVLRLERIRQTKQDYYELDTLFGATLIRPELAVRIAG